jgi:hypothetical protein
MKWYICATSVVLIASCSKKDHPVKIDEPVTNQGGILTQHQWYYYSERKINYNDSTNAIVSDTTVYFSNSLCTSPNYISLNQDSSASLYQNCVTLNLLPGAYWKLSTDSSFIVYIPFARSSYGTGYITGNAGVQPGKLVILRDSLFTTKITELWMACWPCVKYRTERYISYKAK